MTAITAAGAAHQPAATPRWIASSLNVKEGRDPLGLQTTTQDRLMPRLLPGILELSRRARYLSFHAYLLDRYRDLRLPADGNSLSTFIKAREWEYGLAVLLCPHGCDSSPVGASSLRSIVHEQMETFPRGQSVESAFGGYGLYYRSPLAELGIVARAGTQLGEKPTPIDVLRDTERARGLVRAFGGAVANTEYVNTWMLTSDRIPAGVLVEYAEVACLCQLRVRPDEREAVQAALLGQDESAGQVAPNDELGDSSAREADGELSATQGTASDLSLDADRSGEDLPAAVAQRRLSVAHFLSLIENAPRVVDDEGTYREAMWSASSFRSKAHERVAGQWAGLIAKDVWQDALCSIWSEFCRSGFEASSIGGEGLAWDQVRTIASSLTDGPPELGGSEATAQLAERIASGDARLPGLDGPIHDVELEQIRAATERLDTATSGLIAILELHRRASKRADPGWIAAAQVRSAWQPSLAEVFREISAHLATRPDVTETLWWIVQRYVINVHERIAYSKLPEHTFRFRWEEGRVRFYNNGLGRFPLAAIRQEPLSQITWDLALWELDPSSDASSRRAVLTDRGHRFIDEGLR